MRGMTMICGKRRLRRLSPDLRRRRPRPREQRSKQDACDTGELPPVRGLTATGSLYPFWGRLQENLDQTYPQFPSNVTAGAHAVGWVCLLASPLRRCVLGLIAAGYRIDQPVAVAVLAVLAIGAERESIRLTPSAEVSIASMIYVFAAVVMGPLSGAVVAAAGVLVDLPRRDVPQPILRWGAWTSIRVHRYCGRGARGCGSCWARHQAGSGDCSRQSRRFVVETVTDLGWLRRRHSGARRSSPSCGLLVLRSSRAFLSRRPWWRFLLTPTKLSRPGASFSLRSPPSPRSAAASVPPAARDRGGSSRDANARLSSANLSFATALVATLDARDRYTAGHSAAVAIYACDIASRMGLADARAEPRPSVWSCP